MADTDFFTSIIPSSSGSLEVNFDTNITSLYHAITARLWDEAIRTCEENPVAAKTWVVKHCEKGENDASEKVNTCVVRHCDEEDSYDDEENIMWRFLPIHGACARQAPIGVITALLEAYPDGAKCVDDQGMYALHYACGNQVSREGIRLLLKSYPDAAKIEDPRGMLPIHYVAKWGPSNIAVVDMVLVANRDVGNARDEDGNTPLALAKRGEYPEKDSVVAVLERWLGKGSTSVRFADNNAPPSLAVQRTENVEKSENDPLSPNNCNMPLRSNATADKSDMPSRSTDTADKSGDLPDQKVAEEFASLKRQTEEDQKEIRRLKLQIQALEIQIRCYQGPARAKERDFQNKINTYGKVMSSNDRIDERDDIHQRLVQFGVSGF